MNLYANQFSFDLMSEPWIPVLESNGNCIHVSLTEALRRSHEINMIYCDTPGSTFGVYRLLAAMLQEYIPVADSAEWARLWENGKFLPEQVDQILESCRGRFDLFDAQYPFYQSGDMPVADPSVMYVCEQKQKKCPFKIEISDENGDPMELDTVGRLFDHCTVGTNKLHFSHTLSREHLFCPQCCAQGLVAHSAFAVMDGQPYNYSINGTPPFYVLPRGKNLFETLLLNHITPDFFPPLPQGVKDRGAIWVRDGVVTPWKDSKMENPKGIFQDAGLRDGQTWMPRKYRLHPQPSRNGQVCSNCGRDSDILVRYLSRKAGHKFNDPCKDTLPWCDPWVPYSRKRKVSKTRKGDVIFGEETRTSVVPADGRDVWQDFPSLFIMNNQQGLMDGMNPYLCRGSLYGKRKEETFGAMRPLVIEHVCRVMPITRLSGPQASVSVDVFGLHTDRATRYAWIHQTLDFNSWEMLNDPDIRTAMLWSMSVVFEASSILQNAISLAFTGSDGKEREVGEAVLTSAKEKFWFSLEQPFLEAVSDPRLEGEEEEQCQWLREWSDLVLSEMRLVMETELESVCHSGAMRIKRQYGQRAVWKRVGMLRKRLRQVAPIPEDSSDVDELDGDE